MKNRWDGRKLATLGCLIALDVVATRFLGFSAATIRISFGSVFIILAAFWYGPVEGAMVGGMADVIGCLLAGSGFYPPLMLSPILSGILLGLFRTWVLRKKSCMRFVVATAVSNLVTVLFVSTYALSMLYGTSVTALFISRIPQYIVTTGVCAVIAFSLYYSVVTMMMKQHQMA